MFTISPVSILYSDVKKKKSKSYTSNVLDLFTISQAVVHSTIATDGNFKTKKIQNMKSLTPYLLFLVIVGTQASLLLINWIALFYKGMESLQSSI